MKSNRAYIGFLMIFALLTASCKEYIKYNVENPSSSFLGNKRLEEPNFFDQVAKNHNSLMTQCALYEENFRAFNDSNVLKLPGKNLHSKLQKQLLHSSDSRIVLFTYVNNTKVDSVEFYRNSEVYNETAGCNQYTCLSYLDLKKGEIWQAKYFHQSKFDTPAIICYLKRTIRTDGKIRTDSLNYLDESLEAEMQQYKLY